MLPLIKLLGITAAGSFIGDIAERVILQRTPPMEAVRGVNWTRVIIAAVAIVAVTMLVRQFLPQLFSERGGK